VFVVGVGIVVDFDVVVEIVGDVTIENVDGTGTEN
jgi:hypothetical protein